MLKIIDAHAHIGPWHKFYLPCRDIDATISVMNEVGIQYTIISHHLGLVGMLEQASEQSEEAWVRSGGRILSYLVYDPQQIEESLQIIESSLKKPFFAGIKIHPTQHNCPADDERYRPAWELAYRENLVILAHTWDKSASHPEQNNSYPDLFEKYIEAYPTVRFILGHAGGRYNASLACARLARKYKNVWVDITGDSFAFGRVEYLVNEVSSLRVLFGSDMPWFDPRLALGEVLGADISDEDCANILGLNAMRLFNLPRAGEGNKE